MRMMRGGTLVLIGVALTALSRIAAADTWPIARHDAARTGASLGAIPSGPPKVVWRSYMGGVPRDATARFGLSNASITVASRGGRFIAKDVITQAVLWESDLYGQGRVADIADVNGDGAPDVVAFTDDRAYVLDAATGAASFTSPDGAFGRVAAVRVADMNGDGVADVYLDDGSGAKTGALTAAAYSFAAGFGAPVLLWSRDAGASPPPINSGTDAIIDLDSDGVPEVALASYDEMLLVRGSDGATIASLTIPGSSGHPFSHADAIASELDGAPGSELLVVQSSGQVAGSNGPPGFSAFKVDPLASSGSHLWTRRDASFEAEIVTLADVSVDVDGDGIDEVVFSHRSPATGMAWLTEILDGATGATLSTLPDARFEGAADLDDDPGAELVIAAPSGLSVVSMKGGVLSPIGPPLAGLRAFSIADPALRNKGQVAKRLAVIARPNEPKEVLAGEPSGSVAYADLPTVGSFVRASSLTLGAGGFIAGKAYKPLFGSITDAVPAYHATRPYDQIAMGTTNGTLDVLDAAMLVTNGVVVVGDPPVGTTLGGAMQPTAGAHGGPVIGADALGSFVVLPGSPKGLQVVSAAQSSLVVPPVARWVQPGEGSPSIIAVGGIESAAAVVGIEGYSMTARSAATGALLGSRDLGPGIPWGTPLPIRRVGNDAPLVGIDWRIEGVQIAQTAVDFTTNTTVWTGAPLPYGGFFGSGVGDLDDDGSDEWYSMNGPLNRRAAQNGSIDTFPSLSTAYSIPMIANFTGSAGQELLLQSGIAGPKLVKPGMVPAWEGPVPEQMNVMAGARAVCPNGARFFTPAVQSPSLYAYDGVTGALLGQRTLAGGYAYASPAEAAANGARIGSLTNASAIADAGAQGPAVLVGSSDGHLYALSACTLDLLWVTDLGAPVAEAAIGNTDLDASDEIVVGAADGYIYGLDWPIISGPIEVVFEGADAKGTPLVVDPTALVTVKFPPVQGATGYELALVGPEDKALWSPAYRPATGTSATLSLDGALAGRPYRVLVRALSPDGFSDDTASPPVFIKDDILPVSDAHGAWDADKRPIIELDATDNVGLDHCLIYGEEEGGAPAWLAGDGILSGKSTAAKVALKIPESAWGSSVRFAVDAIDSGGNAGRSYVFGHIDAQGNVMFEPKAAPGSGDAPDVGSIDIDLWRKDSTDVGACAASGPRAQTPSSGGALAFVSGLGLAFALAGRRRRRRI